MRSDSTARASTSLTTEPDDEREQFRTDVLRGLRSSSKSIPSKYLYDSNGSVLFDEICEQPEYYLTRTERRIIHDNAEELRQTLGTNVCLIEPGSGNGEKAEWLLNILDNPVAFVPIEISESHLNMSVDALRERFPAVPVIPICADFLSAEPLPECVPTEHRVVFFPGSTVGNFEPDVAQLLLKRLGELATPSGSVLVGVDLKKDRDVLESAYDEPAGVSAAFATNVLLRMNRELDADFDMAAFDYLAVYDPKHARIGMYLRSGRKQDVRIGDERVSFDAGERVRTEYSYKYSVDEFIAFARRAGLQSRRVFLDDERLYSVHHLVPVANDA